MQDFGAQEIAAATRVMRRGRLFRHLPGNEQGECDHFERALAAHLGVRHALTVSSGTNALICALAGLGIRPGDEVILPAYTFIATAGAVVAAGAVPVMADIDAGLTLDPLDTAARITRRTRAIIAVHMDGKPANLRALRALARRRGLWLIEDVAQAAGGHYRGKPLGAWGDAGCFSFNQFKTLTCGEGGALVTARREVHERAVIHHDMGCAFRLGARGFRTPLFIGGSMRASELQGAILRVQLRKLDAISQGLRRRKQILSAEVAERERPRHDARGDCGSALLLDAGSLATARQWINRLVARGVAAESPLFTRNYFVGDWLPALRPYLKRPLNLRDYAATWDRLGATVRIPIQLSVPLAAQRRLAHEIARVVRAT